MENKLKKRNRGEGEGEKGKSKKYWKLYKKILERRERKGREK